MDKLTSLKNKIESNQIALLGQCQASGERMKKLEESVLTSFDTMNTLAKNQESLQRDMTDTNNKLKDISSMLSQLLEEKVPGSPIRKNRRTAEHEPGDTTMMEGGTS
jgi:predicted  nucleic acid-binding Zn-ribbon protein